MITYRITYSHAQLELGIKRVLLRVFWSDYCSIQSRKAYVELARICIVIQCGIMVVWNRGKRRESLREADMQENLAAKFLISNI